MYYLTCNVIRCLTQVKQYCLLNRPFFFLFKFISTLNLTSGIVISIFEFLWKHQNILVLQSYFLVGKFMFFLNGQVNARASYGLSFGGTCPNLILPEGCNSSIANICLSGDQTSEASHLKKNEWVLYLQNAHHPLLLQQYRKNLENAKRDVQNAFSVSYPESDTVESSYLLNWGCSEPSFFS